MFRIILVPLDGSRFAEAALPLAFSLSRKTKANVHLLTVQELLPTIVSEEWTRAASEWHGKYLDGLVPAARAASNGKISTRLRSGHVVEEIQAEVAERNADLVVMATHGRGGISGIWMGNTADSFIRHADGPVILVRPQEEEDHDLGAEWSPSRILVTLDGTGESEEVLDHALYIGGLFDARFLLLRVIPLPKGFKSSYPPHLIRMNREASDAAMEEASRYLDHHAEKLRNQGHAVDVDVVEAGQAGHGILTKAEEAGCDLIAMSTHGRGRIAKTLLGSTADKVVRGARIPVLLFRPGA